jgi:Na+-transporting methylmalonyl-CoA/oxaloacetate decarboxylase gamma subunit
MEESLFNQGVMLMLAGMGTVFVFLGLLNDLRIEGT